MSLLIDKAMSLSPCHVSSLSSGEIFNENKFDKLATAREKQSLGFMTRSDSNWPVQLQIMIRSLE